MSGTRYTTPNAFDVDPSGAPYAGGQLFFYASGTSTPLDVFSDIGLTQPIEQPVTADSGGHFGSIFLQSQAYKVVFCSAPVAPATVGPQVWTFDPVGQEAVGSNAGLLGEIRAFAGPTTPSLWLSCYGQAISRTTYSALFAVIGTAWGSGDGSTTFNVPDLRGRALFGRDNMGGTAASRLTAAVSGVAGTQLGSTGGDQSLQAHAHGVTDPTHTHGVTDPTHFHSVGLGVAASNGGSFSFKPAGGTTLESTSAAATGISIVAASTNVTVNSFGNGQAQNVPPAAVVNWIIYAGV